MAFETLTIIVERCLLLITLDAFTFFITLGTLIIIDILACLTFPSILFIHDIFTFAILHFVIQSPTVLALEASFILIKFRHSIITLHTLPRNKAFHTVSHILMTFRTVLLSLLITQQLEVPFTIKASGIGAAVTVRSLS